MTRLVRWLLPVVVITGMACSGPDDTDVIDPDTNIGDTDTDALCGNGVVDADETCDTAIPGSCPETCDDDDTCTNDVLSGSDCQAECVTVDIDTCADDDGCCPTDCSSLNDTDCDPVCGNDVIETGELCDGDCAGTCDDQDICTDDTLDGTPGDCDVTCTSVAIDICADDGCCAPGCDSLTDSDCSPDCGNDVVEDGETCDGDCPELCDASDVCTTARLVGTDEDCTAECVFDAVTVCDSTDGCCAPGCDTSNDSDCEPGCGNGVVEAGEDCDDGNDDPSDSCDECALSDTLFRVVDLDLRDPHIFADLDFVGCTDITDTAFGQPGVNPLIGDQLSSDDDDDTLLDLGLLLTFPADDGATTGPVTLASTDCTAPAASTTCTAQAGAATEWTFTRQASGTCLGPIPGTTRPAYTPALATPSSPCFVTDATQATVNLGLFVLTLYDAQIGATSIGDPPTTYVSGLLRGFVDEATAESLIMPQSTPFVGGDTVASLLRGHATNCSPDSDMDTHPTRGAGWWMYFNVRAERIPLTP